MPAPRVGYINRVAGNRVMTVSANVAEGVQTAKVQEDIADELAKTDLGPGVTFRLKGEDEEREKAGAFLMKAFGTAIFLIFAILLAQFNRLTSVGLVLTAVVLSTIGVLLGLLVMGQPFGVVMTGIGVIANAGVIVNNNIVLIDTYDRLRREGVRSLRGDHRDLPRARAAGGADRGDRDPRRAADRVRHQHRVHDARDHGRRAGDAMVDPALHRDRVRPRLCDRADADRDAGGADGDRADAAEAHPLGCRRSAWFGRKPRDALYLTRPVALTTGAQRAVSCCDISLGAVRRVADRLQAGVDQDLLERRIRHHLLIGRGDLVDDGFRRRRRREHADEQLADLVGEAGLDGCRNLRRALQPFVREHRENTHLARLVEFQHLAGDVRRSVPEYGH